MSAVIDWGQLQKKRVFPSFSLPSSYSAIRAHVSDLNFQEVCENLPRERYDNFCAREALVVPMVLNSSEGERFDHQSFQSHVASARRHNRPPDEGIGPAKEQGSIVQDLGRREVAQKIGAPQGSKYLRHTTVQDVMKHLMPVGPGGNPRPPHSARGQPRQQQKAGESFPAAPLSARQPAASKTEAARIDDLEAAVEAAAEAPARRSASANGLNSWTSTPLPQPSAANFLHVNEQEDMASTATAECLEKALSTKGSLNIKRGLPEKLGQGAWMAAPRYTRSMDIKRIHKERREVVAAAKAAVNAGNAGAAQPPKPSNIQQLPQLLEMRRLQGPVMSKLQAKR